MLLTPKWMIRHALLLAAVGVFLALGWWQVLRAGEGNARSVGYAFEWPLLALCAIYVWVRALRRELRPPAEPAEPSVPISPGSRLVSPPAAETRYEEPDDELAAYNRYLAWLHEQDQRQTR